MITHGKYFLQGNVASAEAAILAGCGFYGGYPITPASDLMEYMALQLPKNGGVFIQMEDEIAAIAAIIGAAWTGKKAMTATSGPGFSLMQENIGYAAMTETPIVIVDVMRGGPSTGQPTVLSQGDVMQARFGSHGDYELIALAPNSVQEYFDLTIESFNLSEKYRVPTILLSDAELANMVEKIRVSDSIKLINRNDYKDEYTREFKALGTKNKTTVTGLTHTEEGYPETISQSLHDRLVRRLVNKIVNNEKDISQVEVINPDAKKMIVSYGSASRAAYPILKQDIGLIRPKTLWPFPESIFKNLADGKNIYVYELNLRGYALEVERIARKYGAESVHVTGYLGGKIPTPSEIEKFVGG
jgi:2-oxoglutarate ferredoxin oxidoreductase subunit alpha